MKDHNTINTGLVGLKEICEYCGYSDKRVLALVRDHGFPAVKINGNWESDKILIDKWRREKIRQGQGGNLK